MAEDEDILAQLETAPPAEAPKKGGFGKILMWLVLLGGLGAGGYFGYMKFVAPKMMAPADQATPAQMEASAMREGDELGVMFSLDPFIVNLAGSKGKRFLKVTVTLEMSAPEVRAEFKENQQKIVDSILILLSSKTFEDVYSVQGKFKLKDEITTRVNRFLLLGHVKDAYFTEFVIQ